MNIWIGEFIVAAIIIVVTLTAAYFAGIALSYLSSKMTERK